MRKQTLNFMVMGVLTAIFSGCAANQVSLVDENRVFVEKQDSQKVEILWADVYQQDGQTWVYGTLKQRNYNLSAVQTHIDIQVLSGDGSVFYETFSENVNVPRNRVGKGSDWKRFRVKLDADIAAGSKVYMKAHRGEHDQSAG